MKKCKSFGLVIFMSVFLLSCSVKKKDYTFFFKKYDVQGSISIYNYKNKVFIYTDSIDADRKTLPASTFKITNSLIALNENVISDEKEVVRWDGKAKYFNGNRVTAWEKDTDLKTAFKNSTIWFYEDVAKIIGKPKYAEILGNIKYGNMDLSEQGLDFWNYGNLAISPKQQIELLVKLYDNKLPFSVASMNDVKRMMLIEANSEYSLYGKTGWAKKDGINIGWFIGFISTKGNIYFFATRVNKDEKENNANFSKSRKAITMDIFKNMGFIK